MVKKKGGGKLISLQNTIGVEKLCKGGYCLSEKLRESPKTYVSHLRKANDYLNKSDVYGAFFFLIITLESLEEEEHLHVPHKPSDREKADRYYKILREYKGEQIPKATE